MCSTFKFLAAALVLSRLDQGKKLLNRRIAAKAALDLRRTKDLAPERVISLLTDTPQGVVWQ